MANIGFTHTHISIISLFPIVTVRPFNIIGTTLVPIGQRIERNLSLRKELGIK